MLLGWTNGEWNRSTEEWWPQSYDRASTCCCRSEWHCFCSFNLHEQLRQSSFHVGNTEREREGAVNQSLLYLAIFRYIITRSIIMIQMLENVPAAGYIRRFELLCSLVPCRLANKCEKNISFFSHTPLGGRLGSYETQRSSDGFQNRLAQWLSSSCTRLHWNTSVSTSASFTLRASSNSCQVMVGYAAVVSCQSSQVRCVFQRCIWPTVWSRGAQDEGETGCFSTISITWWTISIWDKTAMRWAFFIYGSSVVQMFYEESM